VRWTSSEWSEWVNNEEFIVSVGHARKLTGVAARVRDDATGPTQLAFVGTPCTYYARRPGVRRTGLHGVNNVESLS
jgi:hypothetical protein